MGGDDSVFEGYRSRRLETFPMLRLIAVDEDFHEEDGDASGREEEEENEGCLEVVHGEGTVLALRPSLHRLLPQGKEFVCFHLSLLLLLILL